MQKKIIALAIAAAFSAPAFADSTVYGVVDAALISVSSTGAKSNVTTLSGGLAGSRIGVKSVEDLSSGLKAVAVVEYALNGQDGTPIGNARQTMLAVAGDFGTAATGLLQTAGYDWQVKFDPAAGSAVSSLTEVNKHFVLGSGAIAARANHALAYISPDMGGLTVAVNYSTDVLNTTTTAGVGSGVATVAGNKTTATLFSATYVAGPLAVGAVYGSTSNDGTGYKADSDMAFGGSYDLGAAKVFGTYQTHKVGNTSNAALTLTNTVGDTDNAISLSVVAPVGSGAVAGSFAKNTIKSTAASDNTTAFTVAYLQGLSKTTTAYAALNRISTDGTTTSTTTVLALGLNKKF